MSCTGASRGLRHVNLNVADVERSVHFYTEALGFALLRDSIETITVDGREIECRQAILTTPGAGDLLALTRVASFPIGPGGVNHLGLVLGSNVEVEATLARAVRAGGTVTRRGEREESGSREVFAYVRDPDGYAIELATQEPLLRLAGAAGDGAREASLPHIDEHWTEVAAPAERIWEVLEQVLVDATGGSAWKRLYAAAVGAHDPTATGRGLAIGTTLVGFHVVAADPPREVLLEGAHRFARYALRFRIEPGTRGAHVGAITDAAFPGLGGMLYRTLVIGSGGHGLVVRWLLRRIKARAEA